MPNHVTNILTIIGEKNEVAKIMSEISGNKEFIDFNKFCPMPEELKTTKSPMTIISQKEYDKQEKNIANGDVINSFTGISRCLTKEVSDEYIKLFGFNNWYDWCCFNWGTKWNAYEQNKICDNEISFLTAWSTPYAAMLNLSKKYPNVEFEIRFSDEDFGFNVGKYTLKNGLEVNHNIPKGGSKEAIKIAADIHGDYDYFLYEYLIDVDTDDEITDFSLSIVELAHEEGCLSEDYPLNVLNKLKEFALEDEQYERVIKIDEIISLKSLENKK